MKIILVGASGTIGKAVAGAVGKMHEVISASRSGQISIDLSNPASIATMYEQVSGIDVVVSAAGTGKFAELDQLSDEDFAFGLGNKLMGQINLVRYGKEYLNENGSFILTTGILAHRGGPGTALISALNAGIEGFVQAASQGLPRGLRLNAVCPPMVKETAQKMGWGDGGMPAAVVADYYVDLVESAHNGKIVGPLHEN